MALEFPITIEGIEWGESSVFREHTAFYKKEDIGRFVSVRPCKEECKGKTYLGIFLGEANISITAQLDKETNKLKIDRCMGNPAILVPDLNEIVFGYECWWGLIENEESLRQITDLDIDNVWYVKALKSLAEQ